METGGDHDSGKLRSGAAADDEVTRKQLRSLRREVEEAAERSERHMSRKLSEMRGADGRRKVADLADF
jgi:hypothetical protein